MLQSKKKILNYIGYLGSSQNLNKNMKKLKITVN